ncbi:hypothetical protein LSH36_49g03023 [Paralvinella palmiformis]|uniref:Uncharacterized protein n=1 Tax=Paralvinella palmiformis TaxID=53620 RepID=A0AAD9K7M1_9ANNE|nr:hypothetical protein LSH36_49g03023 [Paralvinella palmiformis]
MNALMTTAAIFTLLQLGFCLANHNEQLLNGHDVTEGKDEPPKTSRVTRSTYGGHKPNYDYMQKALANLENRLLDENRVKAGDLLQRLAKRKSAFWQPMGGPLPVETRFVSFGDQSESSDEEQLPMSVIRAMRYGRRR